MKTFTAKLAAVKHNWYYVDASGKTLGRLATALAYYLRGKHKVLYTPYIDTGDYVIVLNASKIVVTGNKYYNKIYYHYTGYIGGIKCTAFKDMIISYPERIIENAVKGMLPKNKLGRAMYRKLKVYPNSEHINMAQQPQFLKI